MTRRRRRRYVQAEKPPPPAQQNVENVTEPEVSGEVSTEDVESSSADCSVLGFYGVERRASGRFQDVVRMIDVWLKT